MHIQEPKCSRLRKAVVLSPCLANVRAEQKPKTRTSGGNQGGIASQSDPEGRRTVINGRTPYRAKHGTLDEKFDNDNSDCRARAIGVDLG